MKTLTLSLRLGATADIPIRVESDELTFAPITAMTKSAPVHIASTGHGIPDGWRAAVLNAGGMTELNGTWNAIRDSDFRRLAVIDVNTIAFPGVTSAGFRTYPRAANWRTTPQKTYPGTRRRAWISSGQSAAPCSHR
ncbi:MAG: hypothetical protein IPK44_02470 [Candidatus Accumulibacter sp.]|uniref:hypothetical protein n=1 Tax=Accumulibacter sp. TaxID=2053492 RepID=UPI00258532C4|nr:hypothetical protein [Accumulibacter sp.]MBK8113466.1 hypothetical protein [Accumulibacter sp.]